MRLLQKIIDEEDRAAGVADDGGDGSSGNAQAEEQNENRIQNNIDNGADHISDHGLGGRSLRSDDLTHAGVDHNQRSAQQDKEQIRLGKVSGIGAGTEQIQNRAHKDVNDDRVGSAQQQRKIEGKAGEGVDTRGVAAAHGDGYAGACAGADHAAESRENRGNRHAQGEGGYLIAVSRLPDKVDIRHIVQYHDQNGQHGGNTHLCHQSPYGFRGEDFLRKFVLF